MLQNCCDEFIDLTPVKQTAASPGSKSSNESITDIGKKKLKKDIVKAIKFELEHFPGIDLSQIKTRLLLKNPSYNEQNFGKGSFSKFVEFLGFKVYYVDKEGTRFGPYAKLKS